jgi:vacuolar-type H+-ATPase subunit I/STV1
VAGTGKPVGWATASYAERVAAASPTSGRTLLEIADELYGLAPDEFTPARNARAKTLRADGERDLAAAVTRLPKPSVAAWVVNSLVRHHHAEVEQVLGLGAALREAQSNLDGDELRQLMRERRRLTAAVARQARALAAGLGRRITEPVAEQVEQTLQAALADEDVARAVRSGQLVKPVAATGVDPVAVGEVLAVPDALGFLAAPAVASDAEPADTPSLTVVEDDTRARDDARERVATAESDLAAAEEAARASAERVSELEARSLQIQGDIDELGNRISELEHRLERTDDELSDAEQEADSREQERAAAAEALEGARSVLRRLERS